MTELGRCVAELSRGPQSRTPEAFAKMSLHLAALRTAARADGLESKLRLAQANVIQAGEVRDPVGAWWDVLVCGGGAQASTLAWPRGSADPQAIVSTFAFSIGNLLPSSCVAMAPEQRPPSGDGTVLAVDYLVDGFAQHASLTIDKLGGSQGQVDGWQIDAPAKGGMVFGEVGRYGYRNIDVRLAPTKVIAHPEHIGGMAFLSDGQLVTATQGRFEIIAPRDWSVKVVERPQDKKRFYIRYTFSRDGEYFIVPQVGKQPSIAVNVLTSKEIELPLPKPEFVGSYVCLDTPDTAMLATHSFLFETTLSTGKTVQRQFLIGADGALRIDPAVENSVGMQGPTRDVWVSAAAGKLAVSHLAGVYVYTDHGGQWSNGVRMNGWGENDHIQASLSPDGRWLASTHRIHDVTANRIVFEAGLPSSVALHGLPSWRQDGTLVAFSPSRYPVLCSLAGEKVALRILDPSSPARNDAGTLVALSPDGAWLAAKNARQPNLLIWKVADIMAAAQQPSTRP